MGVKMKYVAPTVRVMRVSMEDSLAGTASVSTKVNVIDWEHGGVMGEITEDDGGDIHLFPY